MKIPPLNQSNRKSRNTPNVMAKKRQTAMNKIVARRTRAQGAY